MKFLNREDELAGLFVLYEPSDLFGHQNPDLLKP